MKDIINKIECGKLCLCVKEHIKGDYYEYYRQSYTIQAEKELLRLAKIGLNIEEKEPSNKGE